MRKRVSAFVLIAFISFVWGGLGTSQTFDGTTYTSKPHQSPASYVLNLFYENDTEEDDFDGDRFKKNLVELNISYNKSNSKPYFQQLTAVEKLTALLLSSVRIIT